MAETENTKINAFSDIILPTFAFLSAVSGPRGAAGAQALVSILGANEQRRNVQRKERRDEEQLQFQREQLRQQNEAERPARELAAAQSQFQLENVRALQGQVGKAVPSSSAVEALGPETSTRLQQALMRGEQVPMPQEAPNAYLRGERMASMAKTPEGAALLTSAGQGDVVNQARSLMPKPANPREFAQDKRQALGIVRSFQQDQIDSKVATQLQKRIAQARTQDELTEAVAAIPVAAGAPKGSIEEQAYRALAPEHGPIRSLELINRAKQDPSTNERTYALIKRKLGEDKANEFLGNMATQTPKKPQYGQDFARVARSAFNKDPDALTDEEFKEADKILEQRELSIARERAGQQPLTPQVADNITTYNSIIDGLNQADKLFDPSVLGPLAGRGVPIAQLWGASSPQTNQLRTTLELVGESWKRLQTGAAISNTEYKNFAKQLPTLNDHPDVFLDKMRTFGAFIQNKGKSYASLVATPRSEVSSQIVPLALTDHSKAGHGVTLPQVLPQSEQTKPAFTIKGIREKGK